jgi:hypothetical protein
MNLVICIINLTKMTAESLKAIVDRFFIEIEQFGTHILLFSLLSIFVNNLSKYISIRFKLYYKIIFKDVTLCAKLIISNSYFSHLCLCWKYIDINLISTI